MKKHLFLLVCLTLVGFTRVVWGQLLIEDFSTGAVGNSITNTPISWSTSGSGNGTFIIANLNPMTYPGYTLGGGNNLSVTKSTLNTSNVGVAFNPAVSSSTNTFYYSFLLNTTTAPSSENYFAGIATIITGNFTARLYIKSVTGGYVLGVAKYSGAQQYNSSPTVLNTGITYLVVIRYSYVSGTTNDSMYMWINPANSFEPDTYSAEAVDIGLTQDGTTLTNNGVFSLRNIVGSANYFIDGIKVAYGATSADAWASLNPGPLPVELTSFNALANGKQVSLTWQTATEVNNYGFEIERSGKLQVESGKWVKVGFVNGSGNSNSPKGYSFTDKSAASGKYTYRLKQIDNNGKYEYSKEVEVDLGSPTAFALEQNYPNPFNPTTTIQYSVVSSQNVTIKVFDVLGNEVAVLVNKKQEPGAYTVEFVTAGLASGTYIYRMQAGEFVQVRKMIVLK